MAKVIIIGAGLAGSLLAIYLAKRGFSVEVYEARGDMRREESAAGRTINLALSNRGIAALREVGMDEYMLVEAVPMNGRMIHSEKGETKLLPYSGRKGEYINSVSRGGLNIALINEAEKYAGVRFHFNRACTDFDCETGEAHFADGQLVKGDTLIATDGAGSPVRQAMERQLAGFASASVFLDHGYKELHIPPRTEMSGQGSNAPPAESGCDARFLLEKNALHIWPRHRFMMIALPNFDGSFTCTLFLAHKGGFAEKNQDLSESSNAADNSADRTFGFDSLSDGSTVNAFFSREFPDAVPLMPTLVEDFYANPTGKLGTVKCWPWNIEGKALLLGDSAHAMVPFYGQGMNCAFEDVRVLDQLLSELPASEGGQIDWKSIYEKYGELRKPNTDAIQEMAIENFYEMRDAVADPVFVRKRQLETKLEHEFPDYFSKYSMVTFRADLPYAIAKSKGNAQDQLLMDICRRNEGLDRREIFEALSAL